MMAYLDGAGPNQPGTIKVIGIGQSLRGDDAAGLAAVSLWQETYQQAETRPEVQVELVELPGIGLLDLLEGAVCAILVDAVRSSSSPGTIHQLAEDQLASFGDGSRSAHGWGVAETLELGRKLSSSSLPPKIVLIGIEAGQVEPGEALSPEVQASLPEAARLIEQHITTSFI
jgi:hydrogenase maturation protease